MRPGWAPQILLITEEFTHRLPDGCKQQIGHRAHIRQPPPVPFRRHSKDQVIGLTGQQPGLLAPQPALDLQPGPLGTQPVATGVVPHPFDMPLRTGLDVSPYHRGATHQQRPRRLAHIVRQRVALLKCGLAVLENLLHRHRSHAFRPS